MKIGSVVNLNIHFRTSNGMSSHHGEDTSCIILDMKFYQDLYVIWTNTFKYLRKIYNCDDLYVYRGEVGCPVDLQMAEPNPLCYELLCGDKKFWIMGDTLMESCKET